MTADVKDRDESRLLRHDCPAMPRNHVGLWLTVSIAQIIA